MGSTVYANSFEKEDTVSGTVTITLPWRSRRIIVTNDSGLENLGLRPRTGSAVSHTIGPGEAFDMDFRTLSITLTSTESVAYRVWAFG